MEKQWMGHPRGLATLFFTEMWERFSYYGMRALLLLYMVAPLEKGGLGLTTEKGASIYGWYTMGVYAMAIPGGWIADRFLGLYRSVLIGGIIIAAGHFAMALPSQQTFYLGLVLIVLGTGLLKPNVSGIVGTLYEKDDARRDAGFSIFYMGINIGAVIAPLICGPLGQKVNWHYGFGAAGIGMTIGVVQYVLGKKHIAPGLARQARREEEERVAEAGTGSSFTPAEWKRIIVIGILFFFSMLFWGAFEQAGSSLNLFADRLTRLDLLGINFPSSTFQSVQPLFVIIFAPIFAWLWLRLASREPSSPTKFAFGLVLVGLSFLLLVPGAAIAQANNIRVSPMWLVGVYLLQTWGELCLSPVGLSMVTKLAPPRIVGLMMGVWFLSISFGNKLGGYTAGFFDKLPLPQLFGAVAGTTIAAGLILFALVKPIRSLMGGVK
ncbi:MAG: proton-dependent oligopeptide transporter, family [Thermoanaerobaculia bacterium]|nr:proton-dependent oligopeptide transporter, family [Thermoanaerobaculia bacterium]